MSKLKVSAIHDPDNDNLAIGVDTAGNVGIGTSSPSQKLHVYQSETNNQCYGVIQNNRTRNAGLLTQTTNGGFYTGTSIGTDTLCWQVYDMSNGERMRIDSSGNLKYNSGYGSVATAYGCRAWVKWNGNNGGIYGSGGVSSVGKAGTGDYDIYWSNSMPDGNYAVTCCSGESRVDRGLSSAGLLTNKVTMVYEDTSGNRVDCDPLMIIAVR